MGNYMITLWLKGFDMILPFFRVWSRRVYGIFEVMYLVFSTVF